MDAGMLLEIAKHKTDAMALFDAAKSLVVNDSKGLKVGQGLIDSAKALKSKVDAIKEKVVDVADKALADKVLSKILIATNFASKEVNAFQDAVTAEKTKIEAREKIRAEIKAKVAANAAAIAQAKVDRAVTSTPAPVTPAPEK